MAWMSLLKRELPFFAGILPIVWQILFFYMPLVCILAFAFISISDGIGIDLYAFVPLLSPLYMRIIMRSIVLALGTAVT